VRPSPSHSCRKNSRGPLSRFHRFRQPSKSAPHAAAARAQCLLRDARMGPGGTLLRSPSLRSQTQTAGLAIQGHGIVSARGGMPPTTKKKKNQKKNAPAAGRLQLPPRPARLVRQARARARPGQGRVPAGAVQADPADVGALGGCGYGAGEVSGRAWGRERARGRASVVGGRGPSPSAKSAAKRWRQPFSNPAVTA
jgi:hypothetical protein